MLSQTPAAIRSRQWHVAALMGFEPDRPASWPMEQVTRAIKVDVALGEEPMLHYIHALMGN